MRAVWRSCEGRGPRAPTHLTGAIFEARQWLEDHERQQATQFQMDGTPLALAGDRDWTDHRKVWETLDAIQTRFAANTCPPQTANATDPVKMLLERAERLGLIE